MRFGIRAHPRTSAAIAFLVSLSAAMIAPAYGGEAARLQPPPHGFFTKLPKEYGRLVRIDGGTVELVLDRTQERLTRRLVPGADLFHHGGPGTPADFARGDRVWVVMEGSAKKGERGDIRLLADEISVQDIHAEWYVLRDVEASSGLLTLDLPPPSGGKPTPVRLHALSATRVKLGARSGTIRDLAPGAALRLQTRYQDGGYVVTLLTDAAGFETLRTEQQRALDRALARDGLPGTAAARRDSVDWEIVVDRTGSLWARTLSAGDRVRLRRQEEVSGGAVTVAVRAVQPWGERTLLLMTPSSPRALPSHAGPVRVSVLMPPPRIGSLPPGLGRAASAEERIEWIMATIYCTCSNSNDVCTGQLYTLTLCDPKACGMPDFVRRKLAAWIAQGKSDTEILHLIEQEQGPDCRRVHLVK